MPLLATRPAGRAAVDVVVFSGAAGRRGRQRRAWSARRILIAGRHRAGDRAPRRVRGGACRCRAACSGSSGRRAAGGERRLHRAASRPSATTSSASSHGARRHADAAGRAWTTRASASSPPPRTSCARRSSRSAGFVELLQDEDLDDETRRRSSARCASRSCGCGSSRRTCSTSPASRPARWSCAASRRTSARCSAMVANEFTPSLGQHESPLELRLRGEPIEATAIPTAWPRSCASYSTTR